MGVASSQRGQSPKPNFLEVLRYLLGFGNYTFFNFEKNFFHSTVVSALVNLRLSIYVMRVNYFTKNRIVPYHIVIYIIQLNIQLRNPSFIIYFNIEFILSLSCVFSTQSFNT